MSDWRELLGRLIAERKKPDVGASEQDVKDIEARLGAPLPSVYRDFLVTVGRGADTVFGGEDVSVSHLAELREGASSLAEELGLELPSRSVPFWGHQGYRFFFFRLGEGDDPAVFVVDEGSTTVERTHERLSEFFRSVIENEMRRPTLPPNVKIYN